MPSSSPGVYLAKTDLAGSAIWVRFYEVDGADCYYCCQLPDGGYVLCGAINSYDSWLIRTDSLGDTLWTRVWDSGTWERARRVVYHDNGLTVFVVRRVSSVPSPCLLRYSMDGDLLWERSYPGVGVVEGFPGSMCLSGDGNGYTFAMSSTWDNTISGTDWEGDILWQEEIVHNSANSALSLERTMDGGYIFSGYEGHFSWPGDSYSLSPPADTGQTWDGWLVKLDSLGHSEWHVHRVMGSRDVYFNHAVQLPQGGYIVAGQIKNGPNNWNGYLLRFAPETGIEGEEPDSGLLTLTPSSNPFTSSVTITCEGEALPGQLMVYDITGRLIRSLSDRQGSSFLWDGHDGSGREVPTGTYLIQGAVEGRVSSVRVVRL